LWVRNMLDLKDVYVARQNIGHLVRRTPLQASAALSERVGSDVWLKLENLQRTGAFKVRGAVNRVASLSAEERVRGMVTASSGNFAVGLAYAARALGGVPVSLFMPVGTPASKVDKLREFDVEIFLSGEQYDDCFDDSKDYQREHGLAYAHSYEDLEIIAGQGTVGLEILEDLPDADAILVPIGGGGLLGGVTVAAKAINPGVMIIGVQVEASPSAYLSFKEGHCYERYKYDFTIAEGLAGGFGIVPFELVKHLIDDVVLVSEQEMREAVFALLEAEHLVVEGSGAVGVAALLFDKVDLKGKKVVSVLSGGNINVDLLFEIMQQSLKRRRGQ
jgi:threonine dehydratase